MNAPIVNYRFGDLYYVTEFVMTKNAMIIDAYNNLKNEDNDKFVENVAKWIRDEFKYPLDNAEQPAAQAQLLMFKKSIMSYLFKKCVEYHWTFPTEVIASGYGICIDTANLTESVLRVKPLNESYVILGEVRDTLTNQLLGYHAWTEQPYKGDRYIIETTIHEEGVQNIIKADDIYGKKLKVYYIKHAQYDETKYVPITSVGGYQIIYLLGLPARRVQLMGYESVIRMKPKKLYKEWREEVKQKREAILNAFKDI